MWLPPRSTPASDGVLSPQRTAADRRFLLPCSRPGLPICACVMQKRCSPHVVVRVENAGDVFCQVSVQNGLDVVPHINYRRAGRVLTQIILCMTSKLSLLIKKEVFEPFRKVPLVVVPYVESQKQETGRAFGKRALHLRGLLTVSQVKVVGGAGGPQSHGVHRVVHVTGDGRVVRHRQDNLRGHVT